MLPEEYVKAAIEDCQLTIRALDVKCGAVLVVLLAPLASLGRIFSTVESLMPFLFSVVAGILFFGLWAFAIGILLRALAPLDNPANHIPPSGFKSQGSYYRGELFQLELVDAMFNRPVIMATKSVEEAAKDLPTANVEMLNELTFEHMKVCYIRAVKFSLLKWAFRFTELWLVVGLGIYLIARYSA